MTQNHAGNAKKYTKLGIYYNILLLVFLISSGLLLTLRAISNSILTSSDIGRVVLIIALLVALIGILLEKAWAKRFILGLYGCVFVSAWSGFGKLSYRSMIEAITLMAMPTIIQVTEISIVLLLGVIFILKKPGKNIAS
ncbi:MAG: hypothetical protein EA367_08940 [Leptolyngbya sp. DLM2.Bin15]|nr:MAG: hypothetical protein EA367_08940 [Leptolyngbya sp. DLM2.Bin15]